MAYRIRPRIVLQPFLGRIFEHHFAITAADLAAKRCGPRVASVQPSADRHKATARPADDKRPAHDLAQLKERMQAIRVWAGRRRAHSSCAVPLLHRVDDSGTPRAAAGSPGAGGTGLATQNWQRLLLRPVTVSRCCGKSYTWTPVEALRRYAIKRAPLLWQTLIDILRRL